MGGAGSASGGGVDSDPWVVGGRSGRECVCIARSCLLRAILLHQSCVSHAFSQGPGPAARMVAVENSSEMKDSNVGSPLVDLTQTLVLSTLQTA